jgi:hypothetical protein
VVPWKDDIPRREWIRKEVVREEERYHQALRDFQRWVVQKVDELCRETWCTMLAACKTKKAVWELGEKLQAYNTFLSHNRGKTLQQVIHDQMTRLFSYGEIKYILLTCGKDADPDSLVDTQKPTPPPSLPKAFRERWERGWDLSEPCPLSEGSYMKSSPNNEPDSFHRSS